MVLAMPTYMVTTINAHDRPRNPNSTSLQIMYIGTTAMTNALAYLMPISDNRVISLDVT